MPLWWNSLTSMAAVQQSRINFSEIPLIHIISNQSTFKKL